MPIYEYVCSDCSLKFELLLPLSEANDEASCPQCHNSAKRVFSTFASFTKDGSGLVSSIGDSCTSCGIPGCNSCGL